MHTIIDIHAEIAELRAELAESLLTRRERASTERRLEAALAEAQRRRKAEEGA